MKKERKPSKETLLMLFCNQAQYKNIKARHKNLTDMSAFFVRVKL